jgi:hypothetical protein
MHEKSRQRGKRRVSLAALLLIGASCVLCGADCNDNGNEDQADIAAGRSDDCNQDGTPDECESLTLEFGPLADSHFLGSAVRTALAADIDGDGIADVAVGVQLTTTRSSVQLHRGVGDGTFLPARSVEQPGSLSSFAAGDIDGDDDPDIVTTSLDRVSLFENLGSGEYALPTSFAAVRFTNFVAIADLTADGLPDLITASTRGAAVEVFINRGSRMFDDGIRVSTRERPTHVASADVDGDGLPDLVVAARGTNDVTVLLQDEPGVGETPLRFVESASYPLEGEDPVIVRTGDLDGDVDQDLVIVHDAGVSVLENEGAGVFLPRTLRKLRTTDALLADLDADGHLDLAAPDPRLLAVTVFRGTRNGPLVERTTFAVNGRPTLLFAADFDGNGTREILGIRPDNGAVFTLGSGTRSNMLEFVDTTFSYTTPPHSLAMGDLDSDGKLDLVAVNGGVTSVTVFHGNGDGSLALPPLTFPVPNASHTSFVTTADLDLDGDLDLVIADRSRHLAHVLLNDSSGSFPSGAQYSVGRNSNRVTVGDLNQDTLPDIVTANPGEGVSILYNTGDATFGRRRDLKAGSTPSAVAVGDLDGDGDNDLVATARGSDELFVFRVTEGGDLARSSVHPIDREPTSLVLADLDNDGDLDVATGNAGGRSVSVLPNLAGRTFGDEKRFALGTEPVFLSAADLNHNGFLDLVTANEADGSISVLQGTGHGATGAESDAFQLAARYPFGSGSRTVLAADLDQDGFLDLAIPNRGSGDGRPGSITVALRRGRPSQALETHRSTICTGVDFERLAASVRHGASAAQGCGYVVPISNQPALPSTTFIDTHRFRDHREFLRSTFPKRFADLSLPDYTALVLRRETRRYFAGTVHRLHTDEGVAFGFTVLYDSSSTDELVNQTEVTTVYEALGAAFQLAPLAYSPQSTEARARAATWLAPRFTVLLPPPAQDEEPTPADGTPTFALRIPEDTEICGTFGEASDGRGLEDEYELQSRIRLRAGTVLLPTESETFAATLVNSLRFGPTRAIATSLAEGTFRVVRLPGGDGITTYRFTYAQPFSLPTGSTLDLALVSPLIFRGRADEPLDPPFVVTEDFLTVRTGSEAIQAEIDGTPRIRYGSCTYSTLPRVEVRVELTDGTTLRLTERYREADSRNDTAPAALVAAVVTMEGKRRIVTNYWQLIYSAARHNSEPRYRIVLDPPLVAPNSVGAIYSIDIFAGLPPERPAEALYRDRDFRVSARLAVRSLTRTPGLEQVLFRRGDVNADGALDLRDTVALLDHLFRGTPRPLCENAADATGDERLNVLDAIALVSVLFGERAALPAPFPNCAMAPKDDSLPCSTYPPCETP